MIFIRGMDLLKTLCDALGIVEPNVRRLSLHVDVNDAVRVDLEYFITADDGEKVLAVLKGLTVCREES